MNTRPRGGIAPAPKAPRRRAACLCDYLTISGNPGAITLAAELLALDDEQLVKQAELLAAAVTHPDLAHAVSLRVGIVLTALARRLAEREEAQQ